MANEQIATKEATEKTEKKYAYARKNLVIPAEWVHVFAKLGEASGLKWTDYCRVVLKKVYDENEAT